MQAKPFFATTEELIDELKAGRQIILMDDEDRENEGDLVMAAEFVTPEDINFMAKYGRGLICLAMSSDYTQKLDLPLMRAGRNDSQYGTNFTVSIEARTGVTTGISAADRAHTIQTAIADVTTKDDIVSPGHIFPLLARDGGVLMRSGHTEASVDLARLAGKKPAGVICEIMNEDGTMARLPDLVPFAEKHKLKIGTIADLVQYRMRYDHLLEYKTSETIKTDYAGAFECRFYVNKIDGAEHVALVKGNFHGTEPTLVRMHNLNSFEDIIGVDKERYRQLEKALIKIDANGSGVCVILRDPRPDALSHALGAIKQPRFSKNGGIFRSYGTGAQILLSLGVKNMILLSNSSPETLPALDGYGLSVVGRMNF
ncbi:MAG: 3,4-dihydroxy-2-butanone-4-phosphate synthase [Pseudomonadota bacterium]